MVAILGGFYFLGKQAGKSVLADTDGFVVLRLSKFYQYFSWLMFAMGAGISLIIIGETESAVIFIILFSSILLIAMGTIFLMWYNNHREIFSDQEISCFSWTGKLSHLDWEKVESVSFNAFSGYLKLKGERGKVLKMHMHLVGLKTLAEMVEKKTGNSAAVLKLPLNGPF